VKAGEESGSDFELSIIFGGVCVYAAKRAIYNNTNLISIQILAHSLIKNTT
jgi:hypothetical protein